MFILNLENSYILTIAVFAKHQIKSKVKTIPLNGVKNSSNRLYSWVLKEG